MPLCRILTKAEEDAARVYLADAGYEVLPGSILERSSYREAHNRGQAVTETRDAALNVRADALMEALLTKVSAVVIAAEQANERKKSRGA
jgi:chromosome partitioning protein